MRSLAVVASWIVLAALGPGRALGQENRETEPYQPPEFVGQPPALPESMAAGEVRRLSLSDALSLAVAGNLGIVLVRHQLESSRLAVRESRGRFEPAITASFGRVDTLTPPDTSDQGTQGDILTVKSDRASLGVSQTLRSGTVLSLDFDNQRTLSDADNAVVPRIFDSSLAASVTQPLLRGFSLDADIPSAEILRAEFATERARRDMEIAVIATVEQTEDAYWDLVGTLEDYHVQVGSLRLAEQQMQLTGRQITAGVRPQSDLISAEGTLAQRQLSLVQAESAIAAASDRLRQILHLPRDEWNTPILPTDAVGFTPATVDPAEAQQRAEDNRPELEQNRIDIERADFDLRVADNQRLPAVDLRLGYGLRGQAETYKSTLSQLFSNDARSYSVFVDVRWTPLGRADRARAESLRVSRRAAETQHEQRRLAIHSEVRQALRDVATAERQVRAAARFRVLAERSLDAEQRKFLNGTSDNFLVAQRQGELAQARRAELAALIAHRKALTDLERATGVLLDRRSIELRAIDPAG